MRLCDLVSQDSPLFSLEIAFSMRYATKMQLFKPPVSVSACQRLMVQTEAHDSYSNFEFYEDDYCDYSYSSWMFLCAPFKKKTKLKLVGRITCPEMEKLRGLIPKWTSTNHAAACTR